MDASEPPGFITRLPVIASLVAIVFVTTQPARVASVGQEGTRCVVYALATDNRNLAVTDLTVADFTLKEDGKPRQIVSVEPATVTAQVAVLVDDNGSGIFRYGLGQFVQRVQGRADVSLRVVTGQVRKITEYTDDLRSLSAGLMELGVRPATPDGGQLLEGISEAAKELKRREAPRGVILALTVGGEEQSPLLARHVLDDLHASRAALFVLYAANAAVRNTAAAVKPADLLAGNHNLDQVLGDGPAQSGGRRRDVIATQALLTDLQDVATALNAQYAITYLRPPDRNPPQKMQVSVQRRGITVTAPTRAPAR